jgi:hypothetical protein
MAMFQARRLCPHAVIIRPDMDKYVRVGREVRHPDAGATGQAALDRWPLWILGAPRGSTGSLRPNRSLGLPRAFRPPLALRYRSGYRPTNFWPRLPPISTSLAGLRCRARGSTLSGAKTGDLHLPRRSGIAGPLGARWHHPHRRPCGHARSRAQTPLGGRGPAPFRDWPAALMPDRSHPNVKPRASRRRRPLRRISPRFARANAGCGCCAKSSRLGSRLRILPLQASGSSLRPRISGCERGRARLIRADSRQRFSRPAASFCEARPTEPSFV